ncbi:hypothetical protein LLG95_05925 [bacterium]|nr:hypothetical protein [bacterium]
MIIPPVMLITMMSVIYSAHSVRPDQLQPRAELLVVKPQLTADSTKTLEQLIATASKDKAAVALEKIEAGYVGYGNSGNWFPLWDGDRPLSPDQVQWLTKHVEWIRDLLQGTADSVPTLTYEQAAILNDEGLGRLYVEIVSRYMYFTNYANILAAESRHRRESGDLSGAAGALMAIYRLSHATARPFEVGRRIAASMQSTANKELMHWLATAAMPTEIAARIRDQLVKSPITLADARRTIELQYRIERVGYCKLLNAPFSDVMFHTLQMNSLTHQVKGRSYRDYEPDARHLFSVFFRNPIETATDVFAATTTSSHMKSNASENLERFDGYYRSILSDIDRNQPMTQPRIAPEMLPMSPPEITYAMICNNLAQLRALTMALNNIANGSPGSEPDPYANEPIKVVHTNDATFYYSVGPDRTDDHGLIPYDATKTPLRPTPGDIVVRIPNRP